MSSYQQPGSIGLRDSQHLTKDIQIRRSELSEVTERLSEESTMLGDAIAQLVKQLDMVTRKEPEQPSNAVASPMPNTDAASRLHSILQQVKQSKDTVVRQLTLLEV